MKNLKATSPSAMHTSGEIWQYLPVSSAIKQWATELKSLVGSSFDPELWSLSGHAVALLSDDIELSRHLLQSVAEAAEMLFVVIPADVILDLQTRLQEIPDDSPSLVYLEPGQWLGNCLEGDEETLGFSRYPGHDEANAFVFRKELRVFLEETLSKKPIILTTSLKSIDHLDIHLRRTLCFDRRIQVPSIPDEMLAQAFVDQIGISRIDHTITNNMDRLGVLLSYAYPDLRRRHLLKQAVLRLSWRENRKVSINDLITFATYGTADEDEKLVPFESLHFHAIHEAGHSLIAYLSSGQKSPPVYCSIKPKIGQFGVVVTAYEECESETKEWSYSDAINQIRIALAGRAAEHLVFGAENVSLRGASSDLQRASQFASWIFGRLGLPLNTDGDEAAADNLAIICDPSAPADHAKTSEVVRIFLQRQFLIVLGMLRENLPLLNAISDALVEKGAIFREDFLQIVELKKVLDISDTSLPRDLPKLC